MRAKSVSYRLSIVPTIGAVMAPVATWAQDISSPGARASVMSSLPRDLSPWGMFVNADVVVKAVLIGLTFASVLTWTVYLAKSIELLIGKRRARKDFRSLSSTRSLTESIERFANIRTTVGLLVEAAAAELRLSTHPLEPLERDGVKERIASRLERIEAATGRRLSRGTGILATIGATAPFVGLFGTVWGIMNSFIGISKSLTTNLAIVAPGIAEALLATAFGLAAAIPAVVIYNLFARQVAGYRATLADASAEILRQAGRTIDQEVVAALPQGRKPKALSIAE